MSSSWAVFGKCNPLYYISCISSSFQHRILAIFFSLVLSSQSLRVTLYQTFLISLLRLPSLSSTLMHGRFTEGMRKQGTWLNPLHVINPFSLYVVSLPYALPSPCCLPPSHLQTKTDGGSLKIILLGDAEKGMMDRESPFFL